MIIDGSQGGMILVSGNDGDRSFIIRADGPKGETGDTGPQGDAATIQIGTVTSSVSGGAGSVVNSGSSRDAVLDFVLPRGNTGEQGPPGAAGEAVITGIGSAASLSRKVAETSSVGAAETGLWTRLLTFPTTGTFSWSNKVFLVTAGTQYVSGSALLQFACSNQSSGTVATLRYLVSAGSAYLHSDGFKVTRNAHGEPIELWMRNKGAYLSFAVWEVAGTGGGPSAAVWLNSQGWQSEPAGTGFNVTAEPPAFFGAPLVTTTGTATLTNKTLTNPTIDFPRVHTVYDQSGNPALYMGSTANAVNYLWAANAQAGAMPMWRAVGSDTNINMGFRTKGSGTYIFQSAAGLNALEIVPVDSAVNYLRIDNSTTGNPLAIRSIGSDATVGINFVPKGGGNVTVSGNPVGVKVAVPATATSTGAPGQWAADSSYHYVCTATNTWRRAALSTW